VLDLGGLLDQVYTYGMTDAEPIAALEERVARLEKAFAASANKLGEIIAGVLELKQLNRELARLNDVDLDDAGKPVLQ
jgi:hypothetical protein